MDYKGLRHIKQLPRTEVMVMLFVLVLTVFVGLIEAVAVGLVLSSILFMKIISDFIEHRTHVAPLNSFAREVPWKDEGDTLDKFGHKVYIKHLDGPLFFGFASRFHDMIKALPEVEVVIIRMDRVPYVDQSGMYAMENAIEELHADGIHVAFTDLHGQPRDYFEAINIVPSLVPEELCFHDFAEAQDWIKNHLQSENGKKKIA
jgi:SulP family sulfate permease